MDYFAHYLNTKLPENHDIMNYSPGEVMFSVVRARNLTHLTIQTTLQYVAFVSDPERSKFMLSLRNPTDR